MFPFGKDTFLMLATFAQESSFRFPSALILFILGVEFPLQINKISRPAFRGAMPWEQLSMKGDFDE